jgi:hypothetical protein
MDRPFFFGLRSMALGLAVCAVVFVACDKDVKVGEQLSGAGGSDGGSTSASPQGSTSQGAGAGSGQGGSACHGDPARWSEILAHPLDCQKNSDCCVATNGCQARAQIVRASDFAEANEVWPYCDTDCVDCIPPGVQVGCVNNKCVGKYVDDDALREAHCGEDPEVIVQPAPDPTFSCGGAARETSGAGGGGGAG